jgi:hypothetical protein
MKEGLRESLGRLVGTGRQSPPLPEVLENAHRLNEVYPINASMWIVLNNSAHELRGQLPSLSELARIAELRQARAQTAALA